MELKNIKDLRSSDLFNLLLYSFIGLAVPMTFVALILTIFGVPLTINGVDTFGLKAILYSLFLVPIAMGLSALIFWLHIALGWKIVRWFLKIGGKM